MSMRVLVFVGSRSQLLQHIPVERTVRSFRAWSPASSFLLKEGITPSGLPCSTTMASRPATGWARPRPPFPMRACWPTS